MTEYPKLASKYAWFEKYDVIPKVVAEAVYDGEIVAKVTATGNIVAYDPSASDGSEVPIGVVVYRDAGANELANIAFRGTFGDIYATVKTADTFSGDGSTTSFTLSRNAVSVISVTVDGTALTEGVDFEVSGNTITFTTAPAVGTDNVVVVYKGKPAEADFWKLAPNILIETVTEI